MFEPTLEPHVRLPFRYSLANLPIIRTSPFSTNDRPSFAPLHWRHYPCPRRTAARGGYLLQYAFDIRTVNIKEYFYCQHAINFYFRPLGASRPSVSITTLFRSTPTGSATRKHRSAPTGPATSTNNNTYVFCRRLAQFEFRDDMAVGRLSRGVASAQSGRRFGWDNAVVSSETSSRMRRRLEWDVVSSETSSRMRRRRLEWDVVVSNETSSRMRRRLEWDVASNEASWWPQMTRRVFSDRSFVSSQLKSKQSSQLKLCT